MIASETSRIRTNPGAISARALRRAVGIAALLALVAGLGAWWAVDGDEWQAAHSSLPELERLAESEHPPEPSLYYLGRRLLEAGRAGESYGAFNQAVQSFPASARARAGEIEALMAAGRWEGAARSLAAVPPVQARLIEFQVLRARLLLEGQHQPQEAARLLESLARQAPNRAEIHYWLGRAWAERARPDLSLAAFQQAVHTDPGKFQYHRELAQAYVHRNQLADAVAELRRARALAPEDPTALYLLGGCLASAGRGAAERDEASRALLEADRLRPGNAGVQAALGELAQATRDFGGAAVRYEEALRLDPSYSEALYHLAECRYRLRDAQDGDHLMRAYDRLSRLARAPLSPLEARDPPSPSAWRAIARIYRQSGLAELARISEARAAVAASSSGTAATRPATPGRRP